MSKKNNAVVKKTPSEVGNVIDRSADAGMGTENVDKDSRAIPYLKLLQPLSPEVIKEELEGAKAGLYINSVTKELFEQVTVIPCGFHRTYIEWGKRDSGEGFIAAHTPVDVDSGKLETFIDEKHGLCIGDHVLRDTRMHFVMIKTASGSWQPAVLSLSVTQIKKSKVWMALILGKEDQTADGVKYNPASFSYEYTLTSINETNSKNQTYKNLVITLGNRVEDDELYAVCRKFTAEISSGLVKIADPTGEEAESDKF